MSNLHDTMDAQVWAKEFMNLWSGQVIGEGNTVDESLMIAWFANAIMAGYDEASRRKDTHIDKLKLLILLTDPSVSNEQMNTLSAKQFNEFIKWIETQ